MKLKEGVSLIGLKMRMRPVTMLAANIWHLNGQELIITSGTEDIPHSPGSLHPYGYALDLRTRYFTDKEKVQVTMDLKHKLANISEHYRVLMEQDHIHVEWRGHLL